MIYKSIFKKNIPNSLYLLIIILWLIYHVFTLNISPLPNFDEVFFSDISSSYATSGKLNLAIGKMPGDNPDEILTYGPVYFSFQGFILEHFGMNIITGRLTSFISGIFIFLCFYFFSKKSLNNSVAIVLVLILLTTDSRFNSSMHSARMDLLAVALYLVAIYLIFRGDNFLLSFLAGVFIALSFLTTPRIVFYFSGIIYLIIHDVFILKRSLKKYLIVGFLSLLILFFWVFSAYGSIYNYVYHFLNLGNYGELNTSGLEKHFGFNGLNFHLINPSFVIFYFVFGLAIINKQLDRISIFVSIIVFSHVIFIREQGPYSAMIISFVYWFIVYNYLKFYKTVSVIKHFNYLLLFLLLFNISSFVLKGFFIYINKEGRRIDYVDAKISPYDLNNKNVLSNYKYFYYVKDRKANFSSMELVSNYLNDSNIGKFQYAILDYATYIQFEEKYKEHIKHKILLKSKLKSKSKLTEFISKKFNIYVNYDGYFIILK
jgi:4-amino-4-deoxy-L-arabinose transferase-like glycosyltransferase